MKNEEYDRLLGVFPDIKQELRALNRFTGDKYMRPIFKHIVEYRGYLYATNANTGIRVKQRLDKKHAEFLKEIETVASRKPTFYARALASYFADGRKAPVLKRIIFNKEFKEDVKLRALKKKEELDKTMQLRVLIGSEFYNWEYIKDALNTLRGPVTIREIKHRNCIVLSDANYEILVMKIMNPSTDPIPYSEAISL